MALKIIFMGTPNFAVPILETICNSKHKILTVYSQPPKKKNRGLKELISPIHDFCNKKGLNLRHPKNLGSDEEYKYIKDLNPDVVLVVAYGKILPKKILSLSEIKFINIHASLLPRWRGAAPIQRSIMNLDKETGISIMKITEQLDAGPYMLQETVKILKEDNHNTLNTKLSYVGSKSIIKALDLIETGKANFIDQDNSKVCYAKKIEKKESLINWNEPAKIIVAKIRGLNPYPGIWFTHNKNRLKIIQASEAEKSGNIGEVLDENLTVGCGKGSLKIEKIQKEGKKILKAKEFLAGYKIKKGENLI